MKIKVNTKTIIKIRKIKWVGISLNHTDNFSLPVPILPVSKKPILATVKKAIPNKINLKHFYVKIYRHFLSFFLFYIFLHFFSFFSSWPFAPCRSSRGIKSFPPRALSEVKFKSVYVALRISDSLKNGNKKRFQKSF